MNKENIFKVFAVIIAIIALSTFGYLFVREWGSVSESPFDSTSLNRRNRNNTSRQSEDIIAKFKSEQDFKDYIANAESETLSTRNPLLSERSMGLEEFGVGDIPANTGLRSPSISESKSAPDRVSGTNVQVLGIDEPDIVKTDGSEIYFSQAGFYDAIPILSPSSEEFSDSEDEETVESSPIIPESKVLPIIPKNNNEVKIIKSFPPSDLSVIGKIDKNGNLLLSKDALVVFSGQTVLGYNISDPKAPKKVWEIELKKNNQLVEARLYNDTFYMVTQEYITISRPCPLEPFSENGRAYSIPCAEIYYPGIPINADVTFTATAIDIGSGKASNTTSFVGSSGDSIVYMSNSSIYITYPYPVDSLGYTYRFLQENKDLYPAEVVEKIGKLQGYDISASSKFNELITIISRYQSSLSSDESLKLENETENRSKDYMKKHKRELQQTGIVKLDVKDLGLAGNGIIPGTLLNQFSMDEYDNHLRVAVTVGGGWFGGVGGSISENANDIYVLDSNVKEVGSVKDLGVEERIYSVRFIGDQGYIVTFKQIDPFFVLDLSNHKNPQVKGELKIPGYSSYLHPLGKDRILGIGKEDNKVKLSLFDVSNSQNPIEESKYSLDEYWSEVLDTQYAFLQDEKHGVFFMPGRKGAYVFSYKNDELKLAKAISEVQAKRALYINDYLYIIGNDKIVVLNENDWEKVNQLGL